MSDRDYHDKFWLCKTCGQCQCPCCDNCQCPTVAAAKAKRGDDS